VCGRPEEEAALANGVNAGEDRERGSIMMRTFLGIASLMMLWAFGGALGAQSKDPVLPEGKLPHKVTGVGATEASARQDAFRKAIESVTSVMDQQHMRSFHITEEYAQKYLLCDGAPGKEIPIHPQLDPFKQWIVSFRTDYNWWKDVVLHDRQAARQIRADDRQTLAGQTVLGLSTLLLMAFGFIRLNEYTHRRYSALLGVAGVGLTSLLLAGWWMFQTGW
jgi:hypothetical protein